MKRDNVFFRARLMTKSERKGNGIKVVFLGPRTQICVRRPPHTDRCARCFAAHRAHLRTPCCCLLLISACGSIAILRRDVGTLLASTGNLPFSPHVQARAAHPARRRFCWSSPPVSLREACSTQAAAEMCSQFVCVYTSNASVLLRAIVVGLYYLHTRWLAGLQIVLLLPLANGIG